MLRYLDSFVHNNMAISIDNIVLDLWISSNTARDMIDERIICISKDVTVVEWEGSKPGSFHKQYSFRLGDGISFWLGHGLVGSGIMIERFRLEFNPNKVGDNLTFKDIHRLLIDSSRDCLSRIARFDLAIDIPVDRAKCFLVKDRRLYIERKHGVEYTQYLGSKSSAVGRVKLYNKAAEAKLDYALTRLELTLDPAKAFEDMNFPVVYYINTPPALGPEVKVTDTDRFILNALLQGYGTLNDLGRKTRAKMEALMANCVERVRITPEIYAGVLQKLSCYLE